MMPGWLPVVLVVLGTAALSAGIGFIYWPAGVIVAGVLTLTAGLLIDDSAGRKRR